MKNVQDEINQFIFANRTMGERTLGASAVHMNGLVVVPVCDIIMVQVRLNIYNQIWEDLE